MYAKLLDRTAAPATGSGSGATDTALATTRAVSAHTGAEYAPLPAPTRIDATRKYAAPEMRCRVSRPSTRIRPARCPGPGDRLLTALHVRPVDPPAPDVRKDDVCRRIPGKTQLGVRARHRLGAHVQGAAKRRANSAHCEMCRYAIQSRR